ncbi:ABC transporter permease [Shouchella hunanensis]|uniref:ABC transporter permease n=1 Tax=Shouchella hunanensis TaxID=766894 RepID=A0ABY7W6R6_9BACI|nr:ABC transporter permease [Shouchella hunanensis]WDF04549.1 ABC transporter permease [Shouchella hunanensis]
MKTQAIVTNCVRVLLFLLVAVFLYWTASEGMYIHLYESSGEFLRLLGEHVALVLVSSLVAVLVALPLAVFVTRPKFRRAEWITSNVANLAQTIPSLAVVALMIGILGIGFVPAVFALFIYSVLPIFRNAAAGFSSVNPDLIDAGRGMGMKPIDIFFKVEVPNAAYAIIGGLRTAIVLNVGTAAFAYFIGGGGLGLWIFTGIELYDNSYLISGAVPVTLLAIFFDYLLRGVERLLTPKGMRVSKKQAHLKTTATA